jgi:hypothetical protein
VQRFFRLRQAGKLAAELGMTFTELSGMAAAEVAELQAVHDAFVDWQQEQQRQAEERMRREIDR